MSLPLFPDLTPTIFKNGSAAKEVTLELVPQGFCASECVLLALVCRVSTPLWAWAPKLPKERRAFP